MKASAIASGGLGPARRITIANESSFGWTGCTVVLNDTFTYAMRDLAPGTSEGIMAFKFKKEDGGPLMSNQSIEKAAIRCREGSATVVPK
jgi:hypothetical protein